MSSQAHEFAAPLLEALLPVPGQDLGACATCHSSVGGTWWTCYPCSQAEQFLDGDMPRIIPISLSLEGGQLHHALRNYKDGRDDRVRATFTLQLAGLLELYLASHAACVGPYDRATCVPSRRGRTAFESVISRMHRFSQTYEPLLEIADSTIESHELSGERFRARRSLPGERVLILDDTFTTGASVASATKVLRRAGAMVDTVLVIGRHIRRSYQPSAELLDRLQNLAWSEDECAICRPSTASSLF